MTTHQSQLQHDAGGAAAAAQPDLRYDTTPLSLPPLVAQIPTKSQHQRPSEESRRARAARAHERAGSEDLTYKSSSISSVGQSSVSTIASTGFLDEKAQHKPHRHSHHRTHTVDPEKAMRMSQHGEHNHVPVQITQLPVTYMDDDVLDEVQIIQAEKAVRILLYLAGPCVIVSALNAGWTLISLFITILTQPVRLCAKRPSFGQQLGGLLGPALNMQLKSIYTPLPPYANEDTTYHPGMLVFVQLSSPLLALVMMMAAWVVAVYWVSSVVVGDPAGTDKRDDGREAALALRQWWQSWLTRSIRDA